MRTKFEHFFIEITQWKEVTHAQIWWCSWPSHITSKKRNHTQGWKTFLSASLENFGLCSLSVEPHPVGTATRSKLKSWSCKSILRILLTLWSDIPNAIARFRRECLRDRFTAALPIQLLMFKAGVLLHSCIVHVFPFSCMLPSGKAVWRKFFKQLYSHLNSDCIREHYFVLRVIESLPKSSLRHNQIFVVFEIPLCRANPQFSPFKAVMAIEIGSTTNHNEILFILVSPQPEYYLLQTALSVLPHTVCVYGILLPFSPWLKPAWLCS